MDPSAEVITFVLSAWLEGRRLWAEASLYHSGVIMVHCYLSEQMTMAKY